MIATASGDIDASDNDPVIKTINTSLLLASGSTDCNAYIYDISSTECKAEPIQVLGGHTDIVYSASFHPIDPILATCSGDAQIRFFGF